MSLFPDLLIIARSAIDALLILCAASLIGFAYLPRTWLPQRPGRAILVSISWGMTVTSLAVWLCGSLSGTKFILPVVLLLLIPALFRIKEWGRNLAAAAGDAWKFIKSSPIASAALLLPILCSIPLLLLPVVDSDGLRYHLALPRLFLLEGHISRYPWDVTGAYPQGAEMLYLVGLIIGPGEAAKFIHFSIFILSLTTILLMIRDDDDELHGAFGGALLYAVTPAVLAAASAAFIDNFVVFHLGLACVLLRFREKPALIGLALAGAAWTKWTAVPGIFGCLVALWFATQAGKRWRAILIAVIPSVLVLGPLLVRNTISAGDPFYPVLTGFVRGGVAEVDEPSYRYVTRRHEALPGPLKIPWDASIGKVEWDEVVGWHHLLGLILLPLALRDRRSRLAAAVIIPYLAVEAWFHPSVRLTMPFIWGLAVVEGQLLSKLRLRWALLAALCAAVPLLVFTGLSLLKTPLPYLQGKATRQEIERRSIPGWQAAEFVNKWPGPGRVMALDFPAPYLFKRSWLAEGLVNKPPIRMWLDEAKTVNDLVEKIKQHDIKLIVVTPGYGGGRSYALLPLAQNDHEARLIMQLRQRLKRVFSKDEVDVYLFQD